ncbi:MAG: helix-turn-helix transcriptional regulator [bacterium]|nr:helix-turn-helix transcriptional regulator [bacterium]
MTIAERIKLLRQERKWTQAELAEHLGIHQKQISAYERGVNLPSTDILIKLAGVFDVTLDYLAFETKGGGSGKLNIQDRELLRRFEMVDTLSEQEKSLAKEILDLVILKHRFQELAGTGLTG